MKLTLLEGGKQQKISELSRNPPYGCNMTISITINIHENVIQIHNNKDVKFLSKNLVNISLEA